MFLLESGAAANIRRQATTAKSKIFPLTFDVWAQQAGCLHSALVQKTITTRQKQVSCVRKLLKQHVTNFSCSLLDCLVKKKNQ